jgi:septum formation protein
METLHSRLEEKLQAGEYVAETCDVDGHTYYFLFLFFNEPLMIQYTSVPYKILLASKSPRRQELLRTAGINFDIIHIDVDESFPAELDCEIVPEYLAEKKADAVHTLQDDELLLTADTVVILDGKIFNKPTDKDDAMNMLMQLSGRTHTVVTGVCVKNTKHKHIFSERTDVVFFDISEQQAAFYIEHFKPYDKAGSYGIQDWIGVTSIQQINGCYFNVMGLPVSRLLRELSAF